jgi:hypothetical protein
MTITIPDWIFCGPFWLGFVIGVGGTACAFAYAMRNFKVF